jgi:hypothetical protein
MNTRTAGNAVTAFFVLASCATLAGVVWLIGSELFPYIGAPVSTAGDSTAIQTERAQTGGLADLQQEIYPGPKVADMSKQVGTASSPVIDAAKPDAAKESIANPANRSQIRAAISSPPKIQVVFKIEQRSRRLKKTVWVWRPAVSRVEPADRVTVEARVLSARTVNERADLNPVWNATDPDMVLVSPQPGPENMAMITVLHPGQSKLEVSSNGISKELTVNAAYEDKGMRVEIR